MGGRNNCNDTNNLKDELEYSKKHCLGCLCLEDEYTLQNYKFQCGPLIDVFQMENVQLCYLCKRIAQRTEHFIQSVQSNQIFLENFCNVIDETLKSVQTQSQPLVNLSQVSLPLIELTEDVRQTEESFCMVYSSSSNVHVKVELKEEEMLEHLEGEFINEGNDFSDSFVKHEDGFPYKAFLKEEIELEDIDNTDLMSLSAALKRSKFKKNNKIKKEPSKLKRMTSEDIKYKTLYITIEQCLEERKKLLHDKRYLGCAYKCESCIKGFTLKSSYERHLERHSPSMGDFECDICQQRMETKEKLVSHMKYHLIRYKCIECGITRICRLTIKDHYTAYHCQEQHQYICPQCTKSFKRRISLRKHITYTHKKKERVLCSYCHKSYANNEVLNSHMLMMHTNEVTTGTVTKKYVCQDCGMAFKAPSQLKIHSTKHSHRRDYYCVECDKSFKSDSILKNHLKTAAPHVNYIELPLACLHCDKRFSMRRDLDRHTNRVHLNVKPYTCDKCDKAYVNNWSLTQHRRLTHEGYKRPLQHPCPMCDKIFDRKQILKAHIRTHTGERPYQCTKCPAQFSQSSILRTHDRLIHLKLTRDGRPKAVSKDFLID